MIILSERIYISRPFGQQPEWMMSEGEDEEEGGHGRAAGDKAESKVAKRRCGGSMDL